MTSIHNLEAQPGRSIRDSGKSMPILEQFNEVADDRPECRGEEWPPGIQIDLDDVKEEVDYWNSAIICYVLGVNSSSMVMEGFVRRIYMEDLRCGESSYGGERHIHSKISHHGEYR